MTRLPTFLVFVAVVFLISWFPVWLLIPFPHIGPPNLEGAMKGVLLVFCVIGGLIWVLWDGKNLKRP